jgi:hypothetical protein
MRVALNAYVDAVYCPVAVRSQELAGIVQLFECREQRTAGKDQSNIDKDVKDP